MKEYFEKQLREREPITKELLPKSKGKSIYGNYQIGDIILYFLEMKIIEEKFKIPIFSQVPKPDKEKIIEVREWEYRSYGLKEAPELKTPKQIKQAKSLYDLKLFKLQKIEFQRENFNRFLKYCSDSSYLVEVTEEGEYKKSPRSSYDENLNFLIPWLDQDKLKEAIDSGKLDDLNLFDNSFYPKVIQDYAKQMMIKEIKKHPWYPTIKKMVQKDWIMLKDIAKKISTKKKEVKHWEIDTMVSKLPEYEVDFMKLDKKDEDAHYESYVRSKGGN